MPAAERARRAAAQPGGYREYRAAPDAPVFATLPRVEIFAVGTHRGKHYSAADLDQIVGNFARLNRLIKAPAKIGHEEHQALLENTGIPSVGRVLRVWRERNKLYATLGRVHPKIARLLEGGYYDRVSAEVYDDFEGHGKALRAVAFLGGDLPELKTLTDLPDPVYAYSAYAELPRKRWACVLHLIGARPNPGRGTWTCHAEVRAMADESAVTDPQLAVVQEFGFDTAVLEQIPEELLPVVLAEIIRVWEAAPAEPTAEAGMEPPAEGMAEVDGVEMTRQEIIDELITLGEDAAALEGMSDEELAALLSSRRAEAAGAAPEVAPMSDTTPQRPVQRPAAAQRPGQRPAPGHPRPKKVTVNFSEVQRLVNRAMRPVVKQLSAAQRALALRARQDKARAIDAFCETYKDRIHAHELDDTNPKVPSLKQRLLRLDNRVPVHKYSEGGKAVALTALEMEMEAIKARPPIKFSERIGQKKPDRGNSPARLAAKAYLERRGGRNRGTPANGTAN